jgi:hypothetical protein
LPVALICRKATGKWLAFRLDEIGARPFAETITPDQIKIVLGEASYIWPESIKADAIRTAKHYNFVIRSGQFMYASAIKFMRFLR